MSQGSKNGNHGDLGYIIIKALVELLNGKIVVQNCKLHGTSFALCLDLILLIKY